MRKGEIENRLDTVFHKPETVEFINKILKSIYEVQRLRNITSKVVDGPFGTQLKVEDYQTSGVPILRVSNVNKGEVSEDNLVRISYEKHKQIYRSRVLPNDVLLTKAGAILGYSAVFPAYLIEGNITSHLVTITCKNNILPEYLKIIFHSSIGQKQIYRWGNKSTRPELNTEEVKRIYVPIPPLETQAQIVALFESAYTHKRAKEAQAKALLAGIDGYLLEALEIRLPELTERKKFFYVRASQVSGGRFDAFYYQSEFEELEKALRSGQYELQKLGTFLNQINYGASVKNEYAETGIPFLRISDLKRNEISISEMMYLPEIMQKDLGNAFVYEGDFLISRSGTIGVVAIVTKEFDSFAYGSFMIKFRLKKDVSVNKDFLSYFFNSEIMQKIIARNKIGAIQGNITIPTIKNLLIPLPPLPIQTEIATHITAIRAQAKQLEQEAKEIVEQAKQQVEKMILGDLF